MTGKEAATKHKSHFLPGELGPRGRSREARRSGRGKVGRPGGGRGGAKMRLSEVRHLLPANEVFMLLCGCARKV